jgi:hypothetical protein
MDMFRIIISLCLLYLLTFHIDLGKRYACLCLFYFVGGNILLI